jgi:membrane fusion protein (multidrug efflux system)
MAAAPIIAGGRRPSALHHKTAPSVQRRFVLAQGATMAVLGAALLLGACDRNASGQQGGAPGGGPGGAKAQVNVLTLKPRSVAVTAELPGRTAAALVAEVRPQVGGIIKERLFKEGSEVKAGDPLYQIDDASYQAAYDSAVAAQARAEAAVPSAQAKVERFQGLARQNAVSKQDLDDATASLAQAKADVALARANVDTARINLNYTKITAPISGRIGASSVTVGALVTANQATTLATIRRIDTINVDVTQSSTNLLKFRRAVSEGKLKTTGDNVAVRLKLETGATYPLSGRIEFAEANVDQTTATYTVRAVFPNPDRLLLPGMYVRATIEEGVAEKSFLVPQRAVTRNPKGEAIGRFVNKDGKLEDRPLSVSRSVGNNWLVDGGVADGDKLVVEGPMMARAGMEAVATEVTVDDATGEVRPLTQSSLSGATVAAADPAAPTPANGQN